MLYDSPYGSYTYRELMVIIGMDKDYINKMRLQLLAMPDNGKKVA